MKLLFLLFSIVIALTIIYSRYLNFRSKDSKKNRVNSNIDNWMQMTRQERDAFDEDVKRNTLKRRKLLLSQIRKEYAELSDSVDEKKS